jgi:hypothetical protein
MIATAPQAAHNPTAAEIPTYSPASSEKNPDAGSPSNRKPSASFSDLETVVQTISGHVRGVVKRMEDINLQTRLLALNAQVEAAHAGIHGQAFGVVAEEMVKLSAQTTKLTRDLSEGTGEELGRLKQSVELLATEVRGTRLSDLALTNIDLVDRNLYERSCDVRWWATDGAVVDAVTAGTEAECRHASDRLGVILDAYTVYFDIVLCDLHGRVVANGRPDQFRSQGSMQDGTEWFRSAMATHSGSEFGFQSVHRCPSLAGGQHILVYSCAVREGGQADGRPLGVLGIVFNWEALAQTIVKGTLFTPEEKIHSRVCLSDRNGFVLADSDDGILQDKLDIPELRALFSQNKGHRLVERNGTRTLLAHAASPGYETYRTGWHSVIIQKVV